MSQERGLSWGFSCMQGWRDNMEDVHVAVPSLAAVASNASTASGWSGTSLFAVMDGHGGDQVARFCEHRLPAEIANGSSGDITAALVDAFHRMDELLHDPANLTALRMATATMSPAAAMNALTVMPDFIGCTAVFCCIREDTIVVANAGDSRAVLSRKGVAIDYSQDHKPNLPGERARIRKAGGTIEVQRVGMTTHYRINGNLNLSRSIGDLSYKQNPDLSPSEQMVCSTPDVETFKRHPDDEFLIIACDGVWDVVTSQAAVDFVRDELGSPATVEARIRAGALQLSTVSENLLDRCLSPDLQMTHGLGGDNMTCVIVWLAGSNPEAPKEEPVTRRIGEWLESFRVGGPSLSPTAIGEDPRERSPHTDVTTPRHTNDAGCLGLWSHC